MRDIFVLFLHVYRHRNSTCAAGWDPFGCCRIRIDATPSPDSESWSEASSEPSRLGSHHRRLVHLADAPCTRSAVRDCFEALYSLALPSHADQTKVPSPVFARSQASAWSNRPGPKGPAKEVIDAVVEMKRRNPSWGCPRIAEQISLAFGADIDKDVVRRILAMHFRAESGAGGPSWLTFLGHMKDSLWSADLFRCESLTLRTHWVLVVMDQFTRRIVGFGIHRGIVDGWALCRMFQQAIRRQSVPKYLSTDHDPLYRFHQWQANLRILEVIEVKTVPGVPLSHPFVERLIGTIRR